MNTPRFIRQLLPEASNEPAQKKLIFSSQENKAIIDGFVNDESRMTGMTGSQVIESILIDHYIPNNWSLARIATMVYEDIDHGIFNAAAQFFSEVGSESRTLNSTCDYLPIIKCTLQLLTRATIDINNTSYKEFIYFFNNVIEYLINKTEKVKNPAGKKPLEERIKHLKLMHNSVTGGHQLPAPIVRFILSEWDILHNFDSTYYCLSYLYASLESHRGIYPQERVEFVNNLFLIEKYWEKEGIARKEAEKYAKQPQQMTNYDMANGYVTVPISWLVANPEDALSCQYAGVIEIKNGHRFNKPFGAPHILFFSNDPIVGIITDDFRNHLYQNCLTVWPEFEQVLDSEVEPIYDQFGVIANNDEWIRSPRIGIFAIPEAKDYLYGNPPYGAVITRSNDNQMKGA